ncbi:MAG: FHA domain-containing protein [Planctomycetota bacterium]|nr:FHA domain-containing protein [Planctomycetota bacterium]
MSAQFWPQLLHVKTNQVVPLRIEGETSFGRSPQFYDYSENGSTRWSSNLATELSQSNYIWLSDDTFISRVHGKILHIPGSDTLIYQDLNSTNGSQINFTHLSTTEATYNLAKELKIGADLPTASLNHGDIISVGQEAFAVELVPNPQDILARSRCALLIDGMGQPAPESFDLTKKLLLQKRFYESHIGFVDGQSGDLATAYQRGKSRLTIDMSSTSGFVIIYYRGVVEGETLRLGDHEAETPVSLLRWLDEIPGSKVVMIQSESPATAFEKAFEKFGYRDTLLVTYQGFDLEASAHPAVGSGAQSLREDKKTGTFVPGPKDTLEDVLNALIDPDRPPLRVETLKPYMTIQNRMRFTLGNQLRPLDSYGGIFHSLDFDAGSSLACSVGSFRSK